jgi:subtilisin family serine protease
MPGGWASATVLAAACVAAMAPGVAGASQRTGEATAARQVLVQFAPAVAAHRRTGALAAAGALDARPAGPTGFAVATVPSGRTRAEVLAALRAQPGVVSAQPDTLMTASGTPAAPADPLFPSQWALSNTGQSPHGIAGVAGDDVSALDAWQQVSPASLGAITVAVVDTGVRAEHPDLAASIVGGYDALGASSDSEDDASARADGNGHGTHVAGIIAAAADDGGIVGLARGVKIMPVRALDANGQGTASSVAMGFEWAADHGAQIVNASLGGDVPEALSEVVRRHPSVLFVVAAGNDGRADGPSLCAIPFSNVLCVTATDERDKMPRWANFGAPMVDLAAPGVDIVSDSLHTTSTPLDLDHAAAWDLGPGWTVGDGVLRFHSTGQVANDGSGDDTTNAVLNTPFPVPAGQACHLDYDVASTIPSDDHARGRIELPDGYMDMNWGDTWLGGVRDDVSMPAQGYASWSVRPHFTVNRAVYTVPVAHGDDDITVRRLRLTCSDARMPADSGDVDELSGTSMAAPMGAAAAALVLAATPSARPEDLVGKIECGVDPVNGLGGFQTLSGGRLDARGALAARLGSRPTAPVGHLSTLLAGSQPIALALAPDGSIVFSDQNGAADGYTGFLLKRLRPDGSVETIAGPGTPYDSSDGLAAGHWIGQPRGLAVSPDGSIWFPGYNDGGIRRIDPQGVLHTVAGDQSLRDVHALHAEADGTLLFAHRGSDERPDNEVVSRVTRAGALTLVAGDGTVAEPGAVAPTARHFAQINTITRDADGALMIGERTEYAWVPMDQMWSAIDRLDGDVLKPWLQTRIGAGDGPEGATVDKAWIDLSSFVLVGGTAVIRPQDGTRLWSLAPGGTLARIGGTGGSASSVTPPADGSLATDVQFGEVRELAAAPDGTLFLDDTVAQQLRKIDARTVAVAQPFAPCVGEAAGPEPQAPGGEGGGVAATTTAPPTAAAPGPATIPGMGVLSGASAPSPAAAKAKGKRTITLTARARVFSAHRRLRVVFTVTGTRGAKLRLRCTGPSCPRSLPRATIGRRAIKLAVAGLRSGTTLELRGTLAGERGRYVRLRLTTPHRFTRATGYL